MIPSANPRLARRPTRQPFLWRVGAWLHRLAGVDGACGSPRELLDPACGTMGSVGSAETKTLRIASLALGGIVVLTVTAVVLMLLATVVVNNFRMNDWKRRLFETDPPGDAALVRRGTGYGLLRGNGNHCDRLAWVLLQTDAPVAEVERFYETKIETDSIWVSAERGGAGTVRVEMFEHGDNAGWDLRCH